MPNGEIDHRETTRQDALDAVGAKQSAAQDAWNACTTPQCRQQVTQCMTRLSQCATDIRDAAWVAAAGDPAFTRAVAAIQQATADMNAVAPNMASATAFINSLTSFFTAAGKVAPAIRGVLPA